MALLSHGVYLGRNPQVLYGEQSDPGETGCRNREADSISYPVSPPTKYYSSRFEAMFVFDYLC